ncbi:MAG TPA: hypothetical protein VML54_00200 [Candidatus Limnocylindrales bacterium]|nr:hypothetical protein [Candidatus Limnocylindrales bacterium]
MTIRPRTALFLLLFLATAGGLWGVLFFGSAEKPSESLPLVPGSLLGVPTIRSAIGFRSEEHWLQNFRKHGLAFGDVSASEYLHLARALRDRPAEGDILEHVRRDGVITRFDRSSGAFLAFEKAGTIRIFSKPRDGEAYFRRQQEREPDLE